MSLATGFEDWAEARKRAAQQRDALTAAADAARNAAGRCAEAGLHDTAKRLRSLGDCLDQQARKGA